MTKLKIGTLFSGIGSPEEALKNMKIPHIIEYACDNNKYAKETYLLNHKPKYFYNDVNDIIGKKHKIDMLIFGFPCQPWSVAGKGLGLKDVRGLLIHTAIKILREQKPKYFIAENVAGILNHDAFPEIINLLEKSGYKVSYEVIDSINYGVAQKRKRVWIMGIRKDIHKNMPLVKNPHKKVLLSTVVNKEEVDFIYYATETFLQKEKVINKFKNSSGEFMPCITHTIGRNGSSSEYISYVAAMYKAIGEARKPTPNECLRLFGFPDNFKFPQNMPLTHKYNQIGNTMVVPVVEAIIKAIIK